MHSFAQSTFPKIFYLHKNYKQFWEITIDPTTNAVTQRYGNLFPNGEEDVMTVHNYRASYKSWQEALSVGQHHIDQKALEGFQSFEGNHSQPIRLDIPMTNSIMVNEVPKQSNVNLYESSRMNSSRLKRKPAEPLVREDQKQLKKMESLSEVDKASEASYSNYLEPSDGLGTKIVNFFKRIVTSGKKNEELEEEDNTKKEFPLNRQLLRCGSTIKKKAQDLGLDSEIHDSHVKVKGETRKIEVFEDFLVDYEKELAEQATKEISLSPFLMGMHPVIIKRAEELNVHIEFYEHKLFIQGSHQAIAEFLTYLVELEATPLKEQYEKKNFESLAQKEAALKLNLDVRDNLYSMHKAISELQIKVDNSPSNANYNVNGGQNIDIGGDMNRSFIRSNSEKFLEKGLKFINDSKEYVGNFIKKANMLYPNQNEDVIEMAKRIENLEKKLENQGSKTMQVEFERVFSEFLNTMDDRLRKSNVPNSVMNTSQLRSGMKIEDSDDFIRKEIGRSSYLRTQLEEIKKKAEELEIILESTTYEFFCVLGLERNINRFIVYLHELEIKTKKSLHPQYWNFQDSRQFAMVTVPPNEKEFKDMTRLFTSYMPEFEIVSLERVQNNYLMERFINQIQTIQELKPKEDLSRRQLFYGTGTLNPYFIYKSFDAGFDVRFADHSTSLGFGKGLRFEINPIKCHQRNAYRTPNGNYQLLIADVVLGKTKMSGPNHFTKAPEGFNSVSENGEFFVIYNNFQSYPLYLIEYRAASEFPQDNYLFSSN